MRGKALFVAGLTAAVTVVLGCHHDRHGIAFKPKEECVLPANEARFNNPPSAEYRKPPPKAADPKALAGGNKMGGGPLNPGGF